MKSRRRLMSVLVTLLFVAVSLGIVWGQDQDVADQNVQNQSSQNQDMTPPPPPPNAQAPQGQAPANQQEIPSRVARVQYMSGEVSTQPGGVNDWIAASLNRPLTTSDRIWTDKDSRAELNVGDGFIRMNSETSLTLTNVTGGSVQLELDQGTLELTVKHLAPGEIYEVDTPNFAFTVMKTGVYLFNVYPNQDQSVVTVRKGWGQATGHGQAVRVNSGTQITFSNDQTMQHVAQAAPAPDGFEEWAQVRDKRLDSSLSAQYVSPGVIGYQDLDAYGNWVATGPYGNIWVPNSVPAGWAPYRYGQWVWIAPWGWTWVDAAPWGFAPFHYGRWVSWDGGWGWAPGPVGYWNPYYAPALVGWIGGPGFGVGFGWGGGWGVGIGIGFGWFPLGWGQPFYPHYCGWGWGGWYRGGGYVNGNYFRNVNITNTHITNINNVTNNYFNNRGTNAFPRNGVTSASREAFTRGDPVNRVGGAVPASALNNAHAIDRPGVNPTRESVLGGKTAMAHGGPASTGNRGVVTNTRGGGVRPANVEAANRETMARANSPTTSHPNGAAAGNQGRQTAANTGRTMANGESTHTGSAARGNTPNLAGRTAHPGTTVGSTAGNGTHNVPRPPASNDSFARANGAGSSPMANRQSGGTGARANNYPGSQANRSTSQNGAHSMGTNSMASRSVPRPPAGYTYHPAPAYSGSSSAANRGSGSYGANRSYSGSSRGTYGNQGYGSAGRSYGYGSTPSNRSYGSSPSYSARNYGSPYSRGGSSPSYGSHSYGGSSAPHSSGGYSAPHSYGGYSAPHSYGGGGSYHGGGGGGSHGGGGGGGGGHHGR